MPADVTPGVSLPAVPPPGQVAGTGRGEPELASQMEIPGQVAPVANRSATPEPPGQVVARH